MFFADRIKNINETDKVLEIGPGADPHPRADVLLERSYPTVEEYQKQLGHTIPLITDKKIVFYDGGKFPFADKEFDYVICSHVLEHVDDPQTFLAEVFRISGKGYVEFPLVYYEYLYNINAHLNVLKYDGNVLKFMKKSELPFDSFKPVQELLLQSLQRGHVAMINDLLPFFIEGFEWEGSFEIKKVNELTELTWPAFSLPWPGQTKVPKYSTAFLVKQLIRKIIPVSK